MIHDAGNDAVSDGHREYDYLDWIARMTSHIPEKGAQLVDYYGAYSNADRRIAARRPEAAQISSPRTVWSASYTTLNLVGSPIVTTAARRSRVPTPRPRYFTIRGISGRAPHGRSRPSRPKAMSTRLRR